MGTIFPRHIYDVYVMMYHDEYRWVSIVTHSLRLALEDVGELYPRGFDSVGL